MTKYYRYSSIQQLHGVTNWVKHNCTATDGNYPTVSYEGTVKIDGTNASIVRQLTADTPFMFRSREREIVPGDDHMGFATWGTENIEGLLNPLYRHIASFFENVYPEETEVQIVGEWCGEGISKGVGVCLIPKTFVVFGIRIVPVSENENIWFTRQWVERFIQPFTRSDFHYIYEFDTWVVDVDFSNPSAVQPALEQLARQVEKRCPVAGKLIVDPDSNMILIGEGVVWTPIGSTTSTFVDCGELSFKTKGNLHKVTKTRTVVSINVEKVASIAEFTNNTVTEQRLVQGVAKLEELGNSL